MAQLLSARAVPFLRLVARAPRPTAAAAAGHLLPSLLCPSDSRRMSTHSRSRTPSGEKKQQEWERHHSADIADVAEGLAQLEFGTKPSSAVAAAAAAAPSRVDRSQRYAALTGLFAVYKPRGVTSRDLLNVLVARLSAPSDGSTRPLPQRQRIKAGHGGTLDKAAEGLVVVATQSATKHLSACLAGEKTYVVEGILGVDTDTHDLDEQSQVIRQAREEDWKHITQEQLEAFLEEHYAAVSGGIISQMPPIFSALRLAGQRLSHLARSGQGDTVDLESRARPVRVQHIRVLEWNPPLYRLECAVGSGFYVRSLVRDIGAHFGCGSTMSRLQRTRQSGFDMHSPHCIDMTEVAQQRGHRPPNIPRATTAKVEAPPTAAAAAASTPLDEADAAQPQSADSDAALAAVLASAGLLEQPCLPRPSTLLPFSRAAVESVLTVPLEQRREKGYKPPVAGTVATEL